MSVRWWEVVTVVWVLAALAAAGMGGRSFWVDDVWQKRAWVREARRNDSVGIESVAGRVRWYRSGLAFTNPELVAACEYDSARIGEPTWE